jgi:hypothetical protein
VQAMNVPGDEALAGAHDIKELTRSAPRLVICEGPITSATIAEECCSGTKDWVGIQENTYVYHTTPNLSRGPGPVEIC